MNGRDAVRWPVSERPEAKAVDGVLGQAVAAVVERMNLPAHWPSEAKARGALSGAFKKSIQLLSFLEHTKEYTIAVFFGTHKRVYNCFGPESVLNRPESVLNRTCEAVMK